MNDRPNCGAPVADDLRVDAEVPGQLEARAERSFLQADRRHDQHRHDEEQDQPQAAGDQEEVGRQPAQRSRHVGDSSARLESSRRSAVDDLVEEVVPLRSSASVRILYWWMFASWSWVGERVVRRSARAESAVGFVAGSRVPPRRPPGRAPDTLDRAEVADVFGQRHCRLERVPVVHQRVGVGRMLRRPSGRTMLSTNSMPPVSGRRT